MNEPAAGFPDIGYIGDNSQKVKREIALTVVINHRSSQYIK